MTTYFVDGTTTTHPSPTVVLDGLLRRHRYPPEPCMPRACWRGVFFLPCRTDLADDPTWERLVARHTT